MVDFAHHARTRVILFDGGMGTQIQSRDLTVDGDFWGQENCSEILNLSRPDLVTEIHRDYLVAGADAVETNTFGGSPITLGEFDLQDRAFEINLEAARLAAKRHREPRRRTASALRGRRHRSRHQAAVPGPHRLPRHRGRGGGPDRWPDRRAGSTRCLIETCQDPLQVKAAVNGAEDGAQGRGQAAADPGAGDDRDHRHDAGRHRHRRRHRHHRLARRRR